MFRDDEQTSLCVRALLARMPALRRLWGTEVRPSNDFVFWLDEKADTASTSERALMAVAAALWNGSGPDVPIRMLLQLDNEHLGAVGSLFTAVALGPVAVDRWLAMYGDGAVEMTGRH